MKRKRTSDYPNGDDVEDRDWDKNSDTASFSTSSSIVYQPTAKRRNLDFGDVDETNSVYETGDEDCELWLIRKPKGISLEELLDCKFPKKVPKPNESRVKSWEIASTSDPNDSVGYKEVVTAKFERAAKPMFYMSNRDFYAAEDSEGDDERVDVEIANPSEIFHGVVTIAREIPLMNNFPLMPEENFLEPDPQETEIPKPSRKIRSIRKRAMVDYEALPQRLRAFGVKTMKKRKKAKKHKMGKKDKEELKLKEVKIVQEVMKIKKVKVKQEIEDLSYSFHRENAITKLEPPSDSDQRRRSIKREPIDF